MGRSFVSVDPHPLASHNSSDGSNPAIQPYLSAQLRFRSLN